MRLRPCTLLFSSLLAWAGPGFWQPARAGEADESGEGLDDLLEDELELLSEEETVSTAARHVQPLGRSPSAVVVITRKEIEESGALTLVDLLRRYPGVDTYGFDALFTTLRIRGTYRILLLIDGREANLELLPTPLFDLLPVGLRDLERIEIVFGPNSALYGPNAVSAVVNLITLKPDQTLRAELSVAGGDHGLLLLEGSATGGLGPLSARLSLGVDQSDSWMEAGDRIRDLMRGDLALGLQTPLGDFTLDGGLIHASGRLYSELGFISSDSFLLAHAMADWVWSDWHAKVYWYGVSSAFDLDLDLVHPETGLLLGRLPTFDMTIDTVQAEVQNSWQLFTGNRLQLGLDGRWVGIRCDQLVDPRLDEERVGAFLQDEQQFGERWTLSAGLRFDWNSRTDPSWNPKVALVFQPTPEHALRLGAGTAFRKPTLSETSANFTVIPEPAFPEIKRLFEEEGLSNPNLGNETVTGFDLGYRSRLFDGQLRLTAELYIHLYQNWIGFRTDIRFEGVRIDFANSNVGYENLDEDSFLLGAHAAVEGDPWDWLTLFLRGEYRWHRFLNDWEKFPYTAPWKINAGGTARLPFGLRLDLAFIAAAARIDNLRNPYSALAPEVRAELPGQAYWTASLGWLLALPAGRLELGLTFFDPFGWRFREKNGVTLADGTNFGGELLGPRLVLTARIAY